VGLGKLPAVDVGSSVLLVPVFSITVFIIKNVVY
jgi:hypothetical protein